MNTSESIQRRKSVKRKREIKPTSISKSVSQMPISSLPKKRQPIANNVANIREETSVDTSTLN